MTDPFTPEVRGLAVRLIRAACETGETLSIPARLMPVLVEYLASLAGSLLEEMATDRQPVGVLLDRLTCADLEVP